MVVVEFNQKIGEITLVFFAHRINQLFWRDALLFCTEHDCGAMGIIGANVDAVVAAELLQTHPDVGLNRLHQVAQMKAAIGIGQGTRYQNLSLFHAAILG